MEPEIDADAASAYHRDAWLSKIKCWALSSEFQLPRLESSPILLSLFLSSLIDRQWS